MRAEMYSRHLQRATRDAFRMSVSVSIRSGGAVRVGALNILNLTRGGEIRSARRDKVLPRAEEAEKSRQTTRSAQPAGTNRERVG